MTTYRDSMLILTTVRCPNRCTFCAYENDTAHITAAVPSLEEMVAQTEDFIENALPHITRNNEVYIVNSGSFFSHQVPREYMRWLAQRIKGSGWDLVVECRADSRLERYEREIAALVGASRRMTIAIGLEVADDEVLRRLNKRCTLGQYAAIAERIRSLGAEVKAYILINPPGLLPPEEARRPYKESIDSAIRKAFQTADFAVDTMRCTTLGLSPFYPYKGLRLTDNWWPISTTEAAEVANQLRQVYPAEVDFTNRQIHMWWGDYFRRKKIAKPIDYSRPESVMAARENVARICEETIGRRGGISTGVKKRKKTESCI